MRNITNMIHLKPAKGYGWLVELENQITARAELKPDQFLEFDWHPHNHRPEYFSASVVKRDMTGERLGSTVVALDKNEPIYVAAYGDSGIDERLPLDEVANKAAAELNEIDRY